MDWGTPRLTKNPAQSLLFGMQFCDGMCHVISKGVKAHRDIKPQNCLVTDGGILKVTDFGLAKALDDALHWKRDNSNPSDLNINLSQTGTAAGTWTHMSPEQFEDSKHVDVRADIYSFGVMLFQMISGELPFVGRNFKEFAMLHLKAPVPLHQINHQHIRMVIEKCLRKKPQDRYTDFTELRNDLAIIYKAETGISVASSQLGNEMTALHLVNKGNALGVLRRTGDALACFGKAISLNPSLAEAWLNKGASLIETARHAEAFVCIERALTLKPDLAVAWAYKGRVLLSLQRQSDALSALRRAAELNPQGAATWYGMGWALAEMRRHEEAAAAYQKAVTLDPNAAAA